MTGCPIGLMNTSLIETLRLAQRLGFFGAAPIETAVAHADGFVAALGELPDGTRIADLGSGGGLPGLVLAARYPAASVLLIDRRQKRTDFLERAARRLAFAHVSVFPGDAEQIRREVHAGTRAGFDVVTARGFGPPESTLRLAVGLLVAGGRAVISEPPAGDRWQPALLDELGVENQRVGSVRVFRRFT